MLNRIVSGVLVAAVVLGFTNCKSFAGEPQSQASAAKSGDNENPAEVSTPSDPAPCTLYGYLKVNGQPPAYTTQVKCNPPNSWFSINDTTGFYSCTISNQTSTVALTLSAQNQNTWSGCLCNASSRQCDHNWQ